MSTNWIAARSRLRVAMIVLGPLALAASGCSGETATQNSAIVETPGTKPPEKAFKPNVTPTKPPAKAEPL